MRKQWLFPIGKQKYKIEKQSQNQIDKYTKGQNKPAIYFIVSHILNKLLSLKATKFEKMLSIVLCETIIKFSYMFFLKSLPFPLLTFHHIYGISEMTTHERRTIVTRLRSLMDFSLRCVRFYPGVNSRAELVTLAPGLRQERRFAPLAPG